MRIKPNIVVFDALVVLTLGVGAFVLSAPSDVLELGLSNASEFKNLEIDEIIFAFNILALGLGVFSFRRWREATKAKKLLERRNRDLENALHEIEILKGILPICSFCSKIRDEEGQWNQVEEYFSSKTKTRFSHGVCPECAKKHYPELVQLGESRLNKSCG